MLENIRSDNESKRSFGIGEVTSGKLVVGEVLSKRAHNLDAARLVDIIPLNHSESGTGASDRVDSFFQRSLAEGAPDNLFVLLIGLDFDGNLANFAGNPDDAVATPDGTLSLILGAKTDHDLRMNGKSLRIHQVLVSSRPAADLKERLRNSIDQAWGNAGTLTEDQQRFRAALQESGIFRKEHAYSILNELIISGEKGKERIYPGEAEPRPAPGLEGLHDGALKTGEEIQQSLIQMGGFRINISQFGKVYTFTIKDAASRSEPVWVEKKGYSGTIHFRNTLDQIIDDLVSEQLSGAENAGRDPEGVRDEIVSTYGSQIEETIAAEFSGMVEAIARKNGLVSNVASAALEYGADPEKVHIDKGVVLQTLEEEAHRQPGVSEVFILYAGDEPKSDDQALRYTLSKGSNGVAIGTRDHILEEVDPSLNGIANAASPAELGKWLLQRQLTARIMYGLD